MNLGVDISEFNGNFKVTPDLDFVIIRAGDDDYWDCRLQENIDKAVAAGVPYGLYWLIRNHTIAAAEKTAAALCAFAAEQKVVPSVGIWCDVEDEYDRNPSEAIPYVKAFCGSIQDSGYYAGIYCSWWYYQYLYPSCAAFDCWIADWDDDPDNDPGVGTMKQYSTSGGTLDRDVSYVQLSVYQLNSDPKPALTLDERVKALEDKVKELERKMNK